MANKPIVYLAGPIAGQTAVASMTWRQHAAIRLGEHGIVGVSPMRSKEFLTREGILTNQGYEQHPLSSQKGIVTRDRFDVRTCDVVLANLAAARAVSVGTMIEFGWADALGKPIITVLDVTDDTDPRNHAFVKELSGYIVPTLGEALDIAIAILKVKA